jgi:hypothetical protein
MPAPWPAFGGPAVELVEAPPAISAGVGGIHGRSHQAHWSHGPITKCGARSGARAGRPGWDTTSGGSAILLQRTRLKAEPCGHCGRG